MGEFSPVPSVMRDSYSYIRQMSSEKILTILKYFENDALTEGWVTNLQREKTAQDWVRNGFVPQSCLNALKVLMIESLRGNLSSLSLFPLTRFV